MSPFGRDTERAAAIVGRRKDIKRELRLPYWENRQRMVS
jgi:hypothetical protein